MLKGYYRSIYCGEVQASWVGEMVRVSGWIAEKRNLGKLLFLSLRDRTGYLQVVVKKEQDALFKEVSALPRESAVSFEGKLVERKGEKGERAFELVLESMRFSNGSAPFPIDLKTEATEETSMRYRYLWFRKHEVLRKFEARARIVEKIRQFLSSHRFLEMETPTLTRATPEGARDYLVPSRIHRGKYYALPQSPQLFKQLFMVGGIDRYFQIVRCFRDEDLRLDRQPEFTQVDLELSFVTSEEVRAIVSELVASVWAQEKAESLGEIRTLTYDEAILKYGSDKPDLRFGYEIIGLPSELWSAVMDVATMPEIAGCEGEDLHVAVLPTPEILDRADFWATVQGTFRAHALCTPQWFLRRAEGPSSVPTFSAYEGDKSLPSELWERGIPSIGEETQGFLLAYGPKTGVCKALGEVRSWIGRRLPEVKNKVSALWVVDFPLFEKDATGRWNAMHHPFTAPNTELPPERWQEHLASLKADAYDLVINGVEVGGGSVRIHRSEDQQEIFKILGMDEEEQRARFGFFLEALKFGTPPHAGLAIGLDRFVAELTDARGLREVIAFPKTAQAACLMTEAPSEVPQESLELLGLGLDHKG